uniref:Peptidyl-prolyl cis-trans isomerase n=1 Tax=Rhizophora mucronata TaxID=61149 RepID=A0A2P2JPN8_RHIMU
MAMPSMRILDGWKTVNHLQNKPTQIPELPKQVSLSIPICRRCCILTTLLLPWGLVSLPHTSEARERRNRKTIPLEDYVTGR